MRHVYKKSVRKYYKFVAADVKFKNVRNFIPTKANKALIILDYVATNNYVRLKVGLPIDSATNIKVN